MAGQPKLEPNQLKALKAEYHTERTALRSLPGGQSVAERQAVAEATARMWTAFSMLLLEQGGPTAVADATKASAESARHGALAVKLEKSTTLDRLASLERAVGKGRTAGAGIRAAEKQRGH